MTFAELLHQIFRHGSWSHKIISPLPSLSLYWSTVSIAPWLFNAIMIPWARFFAVALFVLCQHRQLPKSRVTHRKGDVMVFAIYGYGTSQDLACERLPFPLPHCPCHLSLNMGPHTLVEKNVERIKLTWCTEAWCRTPMISKKLSDCWHIWKSHFQNSFELKGSSSKVYWSQWSNNTKYKVNTYV